MQSELHHVRIVVGKFELVGGVELGLDLEGFDRWPLQPQRLGAVAGLTDALHLQRARNLVGIVLQRDHAPDRAGRRIDQNKAAAQGFR